jgi:hypothetical protein
MRVDDDGLAGLSLVNPATFQPSVSTELKDSGFTLVRGSIAQQARDDLLRSIGLPFATGSVHHRSGSPFAARGLLWKVQRLTALLESCGLTALASLLLGDRAFPIDATLFDKHARANWAVPGHQDRSFPVSDDSSRKGRVRAGIAYAEPDAETLAELAALRVHFDATDTETGALRVVPASHLNGVLTTAQILEIPVQRYLPCPAAPGDVLAMRPLLLHRSSPSTGERQRRVLHVVYATKEPGEGIRWRRSAPPGVAEDRSSSPLGRGR